ncbi:hypothetical protein K505DRAFT_241543 [Melanomma pulvis-pyrius CBS 109.77]|uniref:Uncharacterized protein n=1 Tax=Melanomma pulvis-pyrius CBS 109.77 TaxID=1314802 RepID=A0A6A6XE21_9PLEO|nr:hypothetical protein K505DRAFT_241543 [Melanomma pulvis-pyrius CBS 109.77]
MPPYFADRRPEALATGGTIVALLCSDPRLDLRKILVLDGTPCPPVSIVRVPEGRATEAIKAIATMQAVLNPETIITTKSCLDCGMIHVSDRDVRDRLISIAPGENDLIENTKFGEIRVPIKEDLTVLRASTWIKKSTRLIGFEYDTHTGVLDEVQYLKPDW